MPYLQRLIAHHCTHVPFENTSLHYSSTRTLPLSIDHLFTKIVTNRRGGYCLELNTFFAVLLRTLGFELYTVGARVCLADVYTATFVSPFPTP